MAEKIAAGAQKVAKAVQTVLAPELSDIKGSLRVLEKGQADQEKRMDDFTTHFTETIASLKDELRNEIKSGDSNLQAVFEGKIDAVHQSVLDLAKNLEFAQRLSVLEAQMQEMKGKK